MHYCRSIIQKYSGILPDSWCHDCANILFNMQINAGHGSRKHEPAGYIISASKRLLSGISSYNKAIARSSKSIKKKPNLSADKMVRSPPINPVSNQVIIHVVSSLQVGGAERFVIDLCNAQRRSGWHASILSYGSPTDPLVVICSRSGIPVIHRQKYSISSYLRWRRALASADVIHLHSPAVLKPLSIVLPIFERPRIIYTRHGATLPPGRHWSTIHRIAERYIDEVAFVSNECMEKFMSAFDWSEKHSHVVENGIEIPASRLTVGKNPKFRLSMVGRMVPLKQQITLLQALSYLDEPKHERISLDFFGDGECRASLEDYANQQLGKIDVRFHGNVSDRGQIYANTDLLVVTSETEGLSIAMLEAMAYGIPVVATNVGGNPRLVIDGQTGRLFEYDDPQALSTILSELIESPLILEKWGTAARDRVSETFSLQSTTEKYEKIYRGYPAA